MFFYCLLNTLENYFFGGRFVLYEISLRLKSGEHFVLRIIYDAAIVYWNTTKTNFSDQGGVFLMDDTYGVSQFIPGVNLSTDKAYRSTEWYTSAGFAALGW